MKHLIRLTIITLGLILAPSLALASASDGILKIGVIDFQQLLSKAPQAEEAGKRLEKEFKAPKDRLLAKQQEFQTKRDKAKRDGDTMSIAERTKREKELAKLEQDIRHMDEELRADYSSRHREEMDEFVKKVKDIVEQLAKDEKYDLVIAQEATISISDRVDVTDKVLERLVKLKSDKKSDKTEPKADKDKTDKS